MGVGLNVDKVEGWQDQSSNGADVVTETGYQPTFIATSAFNSQPAVAFDQAGFTYLHNTTENLMLGGSPRTVVLVASSSGSAGGAYFTLRRTATISSYLHSHDGTTYFVHTDGVAQNHYVNPPSQFNNVDGQRFVSVAITGNSADAWMRVRVNGMDVNVQPTSSANVENGLSGFTVGNRADNPTPTSGWNGVIAELVVFARVLTDLEINAIEAYATSRYGL
jgi:hypothetical protein